MSSCPTIRGNASTAAWRFWRTNRKLDPGENTPTSIFKELRETVPKKSENGH
jgi:hypothetical protein